MYGHNCLIKKEHCTCPVSCSQYWCLFSAECHGWGLKHSVEEYFWNQSILPTKKRSKLTPSDWHALLCQWSWGCDPSYNWGWKMWKFHEYKTKNYWSSKLIDLKLWVLSLGMFLSADYAVFWTIVQKGEEGGSHPCLKKFVMAFLHKIHITLA